MMSDNKKISNGVNLKPKKASILVYSIVLVFVLIIMAVGAAQVLLTDEKGAISSRETTQAFQVADSGAEIFRAKIKNPAPTDTLNSIFGNLACPSGSKTLTGSVGSGSYVVTFKNTAGSTMTCSGLAVDVGEIRSVGTYAGNSRAIQVAVAAGGCSCIKMVCGPQINNSTGCLSMSADETKLYQLKMDKGDIDPDDGDPDSYNSWHVASKAVIDNAGTADFIKFQRTKGYSWRVRINTAGVGRLQFLNGSSWQNAGNGIKWTVWELSY